MPKMIPSLTKFLFQTKPYVVIIHSVSIWLNSLTVSIDLINRLSVLIGISVSLSDKHTVQNNFLSGFRWTWSPWPASLGAHWRWGLNPQEKAHWSQSFYCVGAETQGLFVVPFQGSKRERLQEVAAVTFALKGQTMTKVLRDLSSGGCACVYMLMFPFSTVERRDPRVLSQHKDAAGWM